MPLFQYIAQFHSKCTKTHQKTFCPELGYEAMTHQVFEMRRLAVYSLFCSFLDTRIGLEEVNTHWRFGDGSPYDYDPPDRHFNGSSDHNCTVLQKQTSHWDWVPRREFNDYSCYLNRPFICRSAPIRGKEVRTMGGCKIGTSQLSQIHILNIHSSDTVNLNSVNSKFALIWPPPPANSLG